jgi:hypothetical protein
MFSQKSHFDSHNRRIKPCENNVNNNKESDNKEIKDVNVNTLQFKYIDLFA